MSSSSVRIVRDIYKFSSHLFRYRIYVGDKNVGVIERLCAPTIPEKNPNYNAIYHLHVDEDYRRQGYGTRLLKHMEEDMWKECISHISVNTSPAAKAFYENNGFVENKCPMWNRVMYGVQRHKSHFKLLV